MPPKRQQQGSRPKEGNPRQPQGPQEVARPPPTEGHQGGKGDQPSTSRPGPDKPQRAAGEAKGGVSPLKETFSVMSIGARRTTEEMSKDEFQIPR